ncbi:MAG: gamma-glutamylcyclotransferase [Devosiaceae bacterium]|nr:gamma-glutamylcyclotransferase [Devosiaceae bacterium]
MLNWIIENAAALFSGAGLVIVLAILRFVPIAGRLFAEKFIKSTSSVRAFPPKKSFYNDAFYVHFEKCFKEAKHFIYITGDGFECKDVKGRKKASNFANMMREALGRGVKIVRVETRPNDNAEWSEMLASIKSQYNDNFELYVFGVSSSNQLSSIGVFDPESSTTSVVEIMLSVSKRFGTNSGDLAGPGIFIRNEPELAKSMADKIIELTKLDDVERADNERDVKNLLSGTSWYFSYGSNMNSKQMKQRIASATFVGIGVLDNHKLSFNRKGSYRPGGVASVEDCVEKVWGVVWEMPSSELAKLTKIEDPTAYSREQKSIIMKNGETLSCNVYVAQKQVDFIAPEKEYMNLIISGAKEFELPPTYIAFLENIKTQ